MEADRPEADGTRRSPLYDELARMGFDVHSPGLSEAGESNGNATNSSPAGTESGTESGTDFPTDTGTEEPDTNTATAVLPRVDNADRRAVHLAEIRDRFGDEAAAAPPAAPAPPAPDSPPPVPPPLNVAPVGHIPAGAPPRPTAANLTHDTVLRARRLRPRRGWRRVIYVATRGKINPGPSAAEMRADDLVTRARTPVRQCHRLAVISLKGGVGKTTTTAALGGMLATLRGDRVVAIDANPDRGTLGERVAGEIQATVRDMLAAGDAIRRYGDVRTFTSQAPSRLEVLSSDSDPGISLAFSDDDYRATIDILERYYNLILTDCGTGLLHSAMRGVLGLADSLVLVSSPTLDGARSASATLDWLEAHGYGELAGRSIAVICAVRHGRDVDVGRLEKHFAARSRAVVQIPYDAHLATGGIVDVEALRPATHTAYLQLAAAVGDGMALPGVPRVHNGF
jgi:MinD-like ATPase involved in chromosome partitioning or flagellar assembly